MLPVPPASVPDHKRIDAKVVQNAAKVVQNMATVRNAVTFTWQCSGPTSLRPFSEDSKNSNHL